ncbi:MAG: hypothetical protein ACOYN6_00155 [Ignavibacteria bacterium]
MTRGRRISYFQQYALYRTFGPIIGFLIVMAFPAIIVNIFINAFFKVELSGGASWFIIIVFWVSVLILYIRSKSKQTSLYKTTSSVYRPSNVTPSLVKPSIISPDKTNNTSNATTNKSSLNQFNNKITNVNSSKKCPLNNNSVEIVINSLKKKSSEYDFDTFDFVDKCTVKEQFCPVRIEAGNRKVCGSRLGLYRTETNKIADYKTTSGSRGRQWKRI